jgi:hypothetical protein
MAKNKKNQRKRSEARRRVKALKRKGRSKVAKNQSKGVNALPAKVKAFHADPNGFTWWLAAGLNYLCSDYEQGVWNPPFPEVHDGDDGPSAETMLTWLNSTHWNSEKESFRTKNGRVLFGWFFMGPEAIFGVAEKAEKQARLHGEDPRKPMSGHVWKVFDTIKIKTDDKLGDKHLPPEDESAADL